MLTVLHRHDDGSETLYSANVVTRDPIVGDQILDGSDVILRGVPAGQEHGPGARRACDDMVVLQAGCRSSGGVLPMVFVMNAQGSTVARYTL